MTDAAARTPAPALPHRALVFAVGAVGLGAAAIAIALARARFFQMDEFVFVRAAWLVGRGEVPYRDFFEHHTPLFYGALAPLVASLPEAAASLVAVRLFCLALAGALLAAVYALGRTLAPPLAAAAATALLAAHPAWIARAIEIRPDLAASAAFAGAALLLARSTPGAPGRRLLAGALLGFALLATQKAAHYLWGLALLPALDAILARRRGRAAVAVALAPWAGLAAVALAFAALLFALDAAAPFWNQNVELAWRWQALDRGFPLASTLGPALAAAPVWTLAVAAGALLAGRDALRRERPPGVAERALAAALLPALASLLTLPSPWPYNFLPVFAAATPLAARALGALALERGAPRRGPALAAAALAVAGALAVVRAAPELARDNARQRALLDRVLALTAPDQPVFDANGGYVFRPAAYFLWYHSSPMRALLRRQLEREVVPALVAAGAPLFLHDPRFDELPANVRAFVAAHYQRYFGPIHLWGEPLAPPPGADPLRFERTVRAVRTGRYFVAPPPGVETSALTVEVDGIERPPRAPFELAAGEHRVRVARGAATGAGYLLWLPRTGELWYPGAAPDVAYYPALF